MSKKKILIITHGFYPEQSPRAFRATELAKEFCRQGHEVTVMAPDRDKMQVLFQEFPIHFRSLGTLKWKLPKINGFGKIGALYNKAINRFLPLLFEFPMIELFFKIKRKLKLERNKYDLLISIAVPYPVHWGVAAYWSKSIEKNLAPKWIADCGDPYCFQENDTFRPPFYFKWIEKWFMRKVDYISVPTETSFKGYFSEFHSKIRIISQGFRFEDIQKKTEINDGVIRFGYGGAFIQGRRDPRELLEFLSNIHHSTHFEFHIFTNSRQLVEAFTVKDSRIKLHLPIPRITLLEKLSSFQFVVNFGNKGTAQTPSKLIDYAIIEKPILHIETGNLNTEAVMQFLEGNYEKKLTVEHSESYRIERIVKQFLKLSDSESKE